MKRFFPVIASLSLLFATHDAARAASQRLVVGGTAPSFTYRLIDGTALSPAALRGRRYILWVMATWCPSCTTGASVVARHIAELRAHGVLVLQMEAAGNLGYPGPSLASIRDGIGSAAHASNWYWGQLTQQQSLTIDPASYPDVYYLVDEHGRVVMQDAAPAAHWSQIETFASAR